jgi:hypothetical protein
MDVEVTGKEIWSYELKLLVFEGVAGIHTPAHEIGIFHVW